MARLLDDAQSEYLARAGLSGISGYPFAFVCFANSNDSGVDGCLMAFAIADTLSGLQEIRFRDPPDNDLVALSTNTVPSILDFCSTTSQWSVDTWHHCCGIFAAETDRRVLLDGGSKGTNATEIPFDALEFTTIGVRGYGTSKHLYLSGRIAEAAIYDLSAYPGANAGEKADYFEANILPHLADGEPPGDYTTGLTAYWPLRDDDEDDAGAFDLTPYNTPSWATHPTILHLLDGTIPVLSGVIGNLQWLQELAGSLGATSGITGNLQWLKELAGSLGAQSSVIGAIDSILVFNLAGLISGQSTLTGKLQWLLELAGSITAQSALTAKLRDLSSLSGSLASQSSLTGNLQWLQELTGSISAQSSLLANLQLVLATMTPEMLAALIDPYSGGAWLWLVEIKIPGYSLMRLARNTEEIIYNGSTYTENNFDIGLVPLTSDGSTPRILLKVAQDADYTLEDKINATKGAGEGRVKIIRVHEDFLDAVIIELEQYVDILTANSDTNHVVFQLGIPDPLLSKIPKRRYVSKVCPWHLPGLFKGVECQYVGADPTCTGKYTDCLTKGNEIHYGADLGLDPKVARV